MAFDPATARPLEFDPSTAKTAGFDPTSAKLTEFDPGTAVEAEEPKATWGDTLGSVPEQIRGGAEQAVGGIAQSLAAEPKPDPLMNAIPGPLRLAGVVPGLLKKGAQALAGQENVEAVDEFGRDVYDLGSATIESSTPENQSFWQKAVSTAATSAGTMVPAGLAAFITKQPGLVAGSFGAQEFGRAYGDAKDKGLDDVQAARHATASGLIEAGTEMLPAKVLFKAGTGPFKRLVNFMAAELPGENIAELGQMVSERINGLDDEITAEQVIETIKLTSAATLLGGSAQSLAASGLEQLTKERPAGEPVAPEAGIPATEVQAQPQGPTLEEIAQADGAELDAMVDEYLAEELPVPDIEAFNAEVSAKPDENIPQNIPAEQNDMLDRRATERGPDRRVDDLLRRDWDSLSEDEKRQVHQEQKRLINTDPMTGIPNRRAYDEAPKKKFTAVADADGLKWVNDNMGHPQGDDMLKQYAQAFQDEGLEVYRGGERGDELIVQSDDQADMEGRLAMAQKRLEGATVEAIHPDGSKISKTGIGFGYGTGKDYPTADERLAASKSEREAAGLRSARGGEPAGVVRTPAQGNQNKSDAPAAQPGSDGDQGLADATGEAPASLTSTERSNTESQAAGLRSGDRNQVLDGQTPAGNEVPSGQVAFDPTTARPADEQQKAPETSEAKVLAESGTSPAPLKQNQQKVPRGTSVEQRRISKKEMIDRGADGHLSHAYERYIPIDRLTGLEPVPAADTPDGQYKPGREITQPIEVTYDPGSDEYTVYGGNHRIAQAKANGQTHIRAFVEAPSGRSIVSAKTENPDARRTSQTNTPEFKRWFGDSKVVDADGKPLVVYHGTAQESVDYRSEEGSSEIGKFDYEGPKFFTSNPDDASNYARNHDGGAVVPVYLSIKNPYVPTEEDGGYDFFIGGEAGDIYEHVDHLIKQGYDGAVWKEKGKPEVWVAFRPSQIKSAIGNRGTFDESDPNILHANPVTAVYKGYQRLGRATLKRVHDAFGWKMTPLGKLPAQQLYLKERYETLGKIADVENISKRIYETFRGLDASEAEKVYEYFTTKDADLSKLSDKPVQYTWKGQKVESTVRKQAETIKRLINKVGDNLVEKGLLSKESHEKYEDAYLPRVYLKHLLGPGASRNFAGGKKPSDMGYLKERKDIPQDVRELILGEITDPGYLASKSLGKSMRDLAILDWFEEIAQNPDWVMPDSLIEYKGSKASIFWLKAEAARIKEQIPYYTPANQAKAQTIVQQMDAIVAKGEAKLQKVTDDYRQAPDTAQYGRMRGMYVRNEIFNDLVGIANQRDPALRWWEQPFEYGGIGTKATQLWKMSKVALNPPTQIRNFISNGILLQLSGVGSHRVLPLMVQAIQEMRENGKHWRIAKKYGITASTFANNELYKIERAFLDLKARNAGKLSMAQLKNMAGIVGDAAGDMYQLSEGIWKTAKIIDAMKREGMSESDAVLEAQKWMYDYSLVPQTVRYFRNTPIGVPFLTFYYKTLPRMLEVMATAPHRFAPYVAIPALFAAAIAEMYDVEPEDVEKLKLALPEWLRDHGHLFFLPFKDKHGRWQAFDFSYLLPWSMFEQLKNNVVDGNVREAIGSAGILGGPVIDLASAIKTGVDPFTKKEIADKSDPPVKQVMSWMNYLWSMAAPTWLTDNGFVGKMHEAITDEVDKQGDPKLTIGQAALRFMGLNMYPIEPEASRRKNMSFMQFEIDEMEKRMNERLRDKNLTMDDKKDIKRVYKEMMNEKRDQLKDYREKSKIHPNLKGDKPPEKPADGYQA